MQSANKSLRLLVEKWFGPVSQLPVRAVRFGRMKSNEQRYVCVEAMQPAGALAIYFFRHGDGAWYVFPAQGERSLKRS
jgi:hypothetical protein